MGSDRSAFPRIRLALILLILIIPGGYFHSHLASHPGGTGCQSLAAEPAPVKTAAPDPLLALNQAFRDAYARTRKETLAQSDPIILVEGDDLVLLHKGKRSAVRFSPELYHTLKAMAHVPLGIYVMLALDVDKELEDHRLAELRTFRDQLLATGKSLEGRGFSKDVRQRQDAILTGARQVLDTVLEKKKLAAADLLAFTRRQAPLVMANAADAARAQLDGLHKQVQSWKAELTAEEWKRLRVVIMGSALPRQSNLNKQYFARLLGEPAEGGRIVYAEALFDESRALNLLGTNLLDSEIGVAFFDDRQRMHRDLLADAAEAYLKEMKFDP